METSVDQVGNMASFINQYGPTAVILAIFIITFMIVLLHNIRNINKTNKMLIEEHGKMLEKLMQSHNKIQENEKQTQTLDIYKTYMKANDQIKHRCNRYLETAAADRTAVYLFHNGTHSTHGFPFFKFSCICERVYRGNLARINDQHDFPVNLMSDLMDYLICNEIYYEFADNHRDTNSVDPMIYKLLTDSHNSFIVKIIMDNTVGTLVGFVLMEFKRSELSPENLETREDCISDMVKELIPIFELSNYTEAYAKSKNQEV